MNSQDIKDFFADNIGHILIGTFLLALILAIILMIHEDHKTYHAWLDECVKDHKEYECVAMYRAGERNIIAIPVPIIVPR